MFTKITFALVIVLGAVSGALAGPKYHSATPHYDVYDSRGGYAGTDPDMNVRHELRRDEARGQQQEPSDPGVEPGHRNEQRVVFRQSRLRCQLFCLLPP